MVKYKLNPAFSCLFSVCAKIPVNFLQRRYIKWHFTILITAVSGKLTTSSTYYTNNAVRLFCFVNQLQSSPDLTNIFQSSYESKGKEIK